MQEGSDDSACQAKTYLEQSAQFQKQIVSLRESRALLDQKQRMREERAVRMSVQFNTILSQMKQSQEDALIAQERNMKLLGLSTRSQPGQLCPGDNEIWTVIQHAKHNLALAHQENPETDQSFATNESYAESSIKVAASVNTTKSECQHFESKEEEMRQARSPESSSKACICDVREVLITGQQRPTQRHTSTDAGSNTNHLTMKESPVSARIMTEAFGAEENSCHPDAVVRELENSNLNHYPKAKLDEERGLLHVLCDNVLHIVGNDVGMQTSPLSSDGVSSPITSKERETKNRTGVETSNMSEQRNALLKIEKNDFFPGIGEYVVHGLEVQDPEMSSCFDESSKQVEETKPYDIDASSSLTSDSTDEVDENENLRNLIISWSLDEKLAALTTLKNTMFLWEDHSSQFGCWPESGTLISSIFAAKDSQLKLFEYLEVQEEDISRALTCCGAVYELVKAYPPEKLVPRKFMTHFLASDDWNNSLQEGLTFEQLEVYQEEHSQFWQMLVHHSICVKDLGLGTLKEVSSLLREIFCPRDLMEELSPEVGLNVYENLLDFLIRSLKGRESGQSQSCSQEESDGSSVPLSYNYMIPVEKSSRYDMRRPQSYKIEAAHPSIRDVVVSDGLELSLLHYDFLDITAAHKSESSFRSRGHKKGIFSSLGSLVRTPFKLWRCRRMSSNGAESMDDGFVRLLSPKRNVLRAQ